MDTSHRSAAQYYQGIQLPHQQDGAQTALAAHGAAMQVARSDVFVVAQRGPTWLHRTLEWEVLSCHPGARAYVGQTYVLISTDPGLSVACHRLASGSAELEHPGAEAERASLAPLQAGSADQAPLRCATTDPWPHEVSEALTWCVCEHRIAYPQCCIGIRRSSRGPRRRRHVFPRLPGLP